MNDTQNFNTLILLSSMGNKVGWECLLHNTLGNQWQEYAIIIPTGIWKSELFHVNFCIRCVSSLILEIVICGIGEHWM